MKINKGRDDHHPIMVSDKKRRTLIWVFWSITILLLLTVVLCIVFYGEPYRFFKNYISDLGNISTPEVIGVPGSGNQPNPLSQWIFTGGFTLIAIGTLIMIGIYIGNKGFYMGWLKVLILFMIFFGALGVAIPADTSHDLYGSQGVLGWLHIVGAALFVSGFGLYNFVSQLLRYIRKHAEKPIDRKRRFDYYFDLSFVVLTFITVAWYLLSGLLVTILGVFNVPYLTEIAQKALLITASIAAFLMDLDDI
jgi:hypothetical protein